MDSTAFIKSYGIGLTGGIASGKSTVANLLRQQAYEVVDADQLARRAVIPHSPAWQQIVKAFGPEILQADETLDRAQLGRLVFADSSKKRALEAILHPAIARLLAEHLQESGMMGQRRPWFYEAALLIETASHARFRQLWVVSCGPALQLQRLMARSGLSREAALAILAQQTDDASRLPLADVVIDTRVALEGVARQVTEALHKLEKAIAHTTHPGGASN